jgi:uncharacterized protein
MTSRPTCMNVRAVFDTNVYVAAALNPGGPSDLWLDLALAPGHSFTLFISEPILLEVQEKLVDKFGLPPALVERFVDRLRRVAHPVAPTPESYPELADPDDAIVLDCALAAKAHLIVSADQHLLTLNPWRGIGICHPRDLKYIFASDLDAAA